MKLTAATWIRRAGVLGEQLPKSRLHRAVLAWADASKPRDRWVVALSGGVDSVALLLLVWLHWPERRPGLEAVHFNHRLRGRAADADEQFCRDLCRALGLRLHVGRRRLTQKVQSEAQARDLRFAMIDRVMLKTASRVLWLGHQQNDVAETMLMRLARGSGAGGLAAPRPVQMMPARRVNLRPLLNLKRVEIESAMAEAKLPWREDSSNDTAAYFRNRVRHEVLPAWIGAAGRDALAGAALSRELIEEDDNALEAWAQRLHAEMPEGRLKLSVLKDVPRAVVRRLLHYWLLARGAEGISRQAFENLLDAVIRGESTRQSMGTKRFAVIRRHELYWDDK